MNRGSKIWCPFDTKDSIFVKYLKECGHKVINSHIDNNQDFFKLDYEKHFDYVISNPPYSLKYEVLKKLFNSNVPFAMLLGVVGLFESKKKV